MATTSRRMIVLVALVVPLMLALVACGGDDGDDAGAGATAAADGGAATVVNVTLGTADNEFAMEPVPSEASAGTVTFAVTNGGAMEHEMVVIKTDKGAANLGEANGEADETGAVDEIVLPAGESGDLTVDLEAGDYALVCNLTGHYASGMYADFTVN
jgi:uncharacterized cupredoxin-like copper-binding protein